MSSAPLIELRDIRREYPSGDGVIPVLKNVNLTINAGEMVAIVGASGSGKSTLMNLLGCLDQPTGGSYRVQGRETSLLDPDDLAALRRENFGFIFQRYHLLAELTAIGNVEIPAIYAGQPAHARRDRAQVLLDRLGMSDRLTHRPNQLSGGQQQRVSIARALMNGADVILADEPTGALDSRSGEDVLGILEELHTDGKTIILVTHDMTVAARAERIIEIRDGEIVGDRSNENRVISRPAPPTPNAQRPAPPPTSRGKITRRLAPVLDRFHEAFRMALLSMVANKLRTVLTMLGIIIGIASVVCVVALGTGSQQQVLANISSLGTNTLEVYPGKDFGDMRSGRVTTLVVDDAVELARQPFVAAVTPTVSTASTVRYGSVEANVQITGAGAQYFNAKGLKLIDGRFFDAQAVQTRAQDVVVDANTLTTLMPNLPYSAVGQVVLVGKVPMRIVGVVEPQKSRFGGSSSLQFYMPYTTVQSRFLGSPTLQSIIVLVDDQMPMDLAEQGVTQFLTQRHRTKDFFLFNTDDIRKTIMATTQTMALLVSSIALISLIVGGIGVMNIMLVTVSERVGEIGVRMAVGARRSDILQQFLIEAVLVCLIGGLMGIGLALGFGLLFNMAGSPFQLVYSPTSIVAAFVCSSLIGIVFGYLPARGASNLNPVTALTRD